MAPGAEEGAVMAAKAEVAAPPDRADTAAAVEGVQVAKDGTEAGGVTVGRGG